MKPEKRVVYGAYGSVEREWWSLNGYMHREDGPAVIVYSEDGSVCWECWYMDGALLSDEQIEDLKLRLEVDKLAEQMLVGEL